MRLVKTSVGESISQFVCHTSSVCCSHYQRSMLPQPRPHKPSSHSLLHSHSLKKVQCYNVLSCTPFSKRTINILTYSKTTKWCRQDMFSLTRDRKDRHSYGLTLMLFKPFKIFRWETGDKILIPNNNPDFPRLPQNGALWSQFTIFTSNLSQWLFSFIFSIHVILVSWSSKSFEKLLDKFPGKIFNENNNGKLQSFFIFPNVFKVPNK